MNKIRRMIATLALAALLVCAAAAEQNSELASRALAVYEALTSEQYVQVAAQFDEAMAAAVDEAALRASMEDVRRQTGAMTAATVAQADEEARVAVLLVECKSGRALLQAAFDEEWRISGLYIQRLNQAAQAQPLERALPEGVEARQVVLFEGEPRELAGEIILPAGADEEMAYVVFAHGSGPNDMDETVGANKPFRDLAYDLAALGVGSLRFDKITFATPDWPVETGEQEYLGPVAEALRVLRAQTGARRVYLAGHSEGGMLTPYLVAECSFDGGIALAGTPKQLWEISYAQNLALLEQTDEAQRAAAAAQVEEQYRLALALPDMSDEEAAETTVFDMSAVYLRHMARMDQAQIARDSGKPFLFLWGTADAQVDREAYAAWSERLGDGPYTYITYDGLNHLFIPAQDGENLMNLMEAYSVPARVDERVARDIADWIAAQ